VSAAGRMSRGSNLSSACFYDLLGAYHVAANCLEQALGRLSLPEPS
jgi:hypothetical protein